MNSAASLEENITKSSYNSHSRQMAEPIHGTWWTINTGQARDIAFHGQSLVRYQSMGMAYVSHLGRRKNDLSAERKKLFVTQVMHVHPDINIGNEVPAREALKLLTFNERIERADDDVAAFQLCRHFVPGIADGIYSRLSTSPRIWRSAMTTFFVSASTSASLRRLSGWCWCLLCGRDDKLSGITLTGETTRKFSRRFLQNW